LAYCLEEETGDIPEMEYATELHPMQPQLQCANEMELLEQQEQILQLQS